jgi:hypothetical protein
MPMNKGSLNVISDCVCLILQEYPPEPKAEELDFVDVEEQEVWVRSFDGFAKEKDVIDHAFDFMDKLRCGGRSFVYRVHHCLRQLGTRMHLSLYMPAPVLPHATVVLLIIAGFFRPGERCFALINLD